MGIFHENITRPPGMGKSYHVHVNHTRTPHFYLYFLFLFSLLLLIFFWTFSWICLTLLSLLSLLSNKQLHNKPIFLCIRLFRLLIVDSLFFHYFNTNGSFASIGLFLVYFCSSDFPLFSFWTHTAIFPLDFHSFCYWYFKCTPLLQLQLSTARSSALHFPTTRTIYVSHIHVLLLLLLLNSSRSSLGTNKEKNHM